MKKYVYPFFQNWSYLYIHNLEHCNDEGHSSEEAEQKF